MCSQVQLVPQLIINYKLKVCEYVMCVMNHKLRRVMCYDRALRICR